MHADECLELAFGLRALGLQLHDALARRRRVGVERREVRTRGEAGAHAARLAFDEGPALGLERLRDVQVLVGGLPLEVAFRDAGGQRRGGGLCVGMRGSGAAERGVERLAVAAPEVEVVREVEREVAAGARRAGDRRRIEAVLRIALAGGLAVECEAGTGGGFGLAGGSVGLAHARLRDGHRRRVLQREGDEAVQLRVAVVA